ncbi:NADPH-dependent oxidoreductase, partial [Burkholderia contaminans]|nr:NADPH-dependent oxidoreductase [Burkholderia contaminans]
EEYQEQSTEGIQAYDRVQADYAGARATTSWSQPLAQQFGQAEPSSTRKNLEQKKLL